MTSSACLVCGGTYGRSRLPGLLACELCGFITADVAISFDKLTALYSRDYFSGGEYRDYVAERALIEQHARRRLAKLSQYIDEPSQKRLFEIGSAYGFFLAVARERFGAVEGIDISVDATAYAATELGLSVYAGDFLEHTLRSAPDVVCLWDTIEHVQHPHLYIEKAVTHMTKRGLLGITTGDIGSLVARWRGPKWRQIHPPTHLHYFSKDTLTRLLRKYGCDVRYCGYEGIYRSLDTMAYIILNIKHKQPRLYQMLKRAGALRGNLYMNLGDIVFVIAQKT